MSLRETLSRLAFKIARVTNFVGAISSQNYSGSELLSLIRARRTSGGEAKILKFRVKFLDPGAYQLLLREIFFDGQYRFDAGTDSPVILDCGANIGLATLFFKHLYPEAQILSFEADPVTATVLETNVEQNQLQGVHVHNLMLSDHEGDSTLYKDANLAGSLSMSANPNRAANHCAIVVKAGKLSSFIDGPIDLLKLDVEGSEGEVIADLRSSGKIGLIRRMVIEYHHKIDGNASCLAGFLSLLEEAGFEYQIAARGCDPITRQGVYQDIHIGAYRGSTD